MSLLLNTVRKGSALRRTLRPAVIWLFDRWSRYQLKRRGYLELFTGRPVDAFKPEFDDLWYLYRVVRKRKPKFIVEFGSGCSTYVLAQALHDNRREDGVGDGYLYSLDADARWAGVTRETMPAHLKSACEIWHSPVDVIDHHGIPCFRHTKIPAVAPNLVYLDGPALTPEVQVAIDVLDMEGALPSDFLLIIDGRSENTAFLQRNLRGRYRFTNRRVLGRIRPQIEFVGTMH